MKAKVDSFKKISKIHLATSTLNKENTQVISQKLKM